MNLPIDEAYLDRIATMVLQFRGQKVMLDRDLAALYGLETKRLKEAVRRNRSRFPTDFMFELNQSEQESLRSQFASSKTKRGGERYANMAFTEHGILMLSSVLNSKKAIELNISIVRVFIQMRKTFAEKNTIQDQLEVLQKKTENNSQNIELLFHYLDELESPAPKQQTRKKIGFKIKGKST